MNTDLPSLPEHALERVQAYLLSLQQSICNELMHIDQHGQFLDDPWTRQEGGGGLTRVLNRGRLFEKAGVNFSHVFGDQLPPSATAARPELIGRRFSAMGVSLVIHPNNPFIPTSHANVRFLMAEKDDGEPLWWFGGGFDLTPYYGFEEDCIHWHRMAKAACDPFGLEIYPRFKAWCDRYFYIKHREEARGVGGLFFDDFHEVSFEHSFALMQSIGDHFLKAYIPIVERRQSMPFTEKEKAFQRYRRGRYVEYNLVYDRGTLFGLQSNGRTESILMSLPPEVTWEYHWSPEANSAEARLYTDFLPVREWI